MWQILSKFLWWDLLAVLLLMRNKFLCANLSLFSAVLLFFASFSFSFLASSFWGFSFWSFGLELEDQGEEACLVIFTKVSHILFSLGAFNCSRCSWWGGWGSPWCVTPEGWRWGEGTWRRLRFRLKMFCFWNVFFFQNCLLARFRTL